MKNPVMGLFLFVCMFGWMIVFYGAATDEIIPDPDSSPKKSKEENYVIQSYKLPYKATFANEPVPLERYDIKERYDKELLSNSYFHSNTILMIKRANRYFPIIEPILKKNNIPEDFKYIALIESGFQPRVVSPAGAAGIWQFLRTTGREYGLEVNGYVDERYHVEKATEAACKYLRKGYDQFGSWTLTAASYNIGRTRISKELKRQASTNYYDLLLPSETMRYVFRALALKQIMKRPADFGFIIHKEDLYPQLEFDVVHTTKPVNNVLDFAKEHQISYYMLKEFNPWMRDTYITNNSGKEYAIKIPKENALTPNPSKIKVHNKNWVVND